MSAVQLTRVTCDACGAAAESPNAPGDTRKILREKGWMSRSERTSHANTRARRDYCPACTQSRALALVPGRM